MSEEQKAPEEIWITELYTADEGYQYGWYSDHEDDRDYPKYIHAAELDRIRAENARLREVLRDAHDCMEADDAYPITRMLILKALVASDGAGE